MKAFGFALLAAALAWGSAAQAAPVPGTSCNVLPADNIWNTDISTLPVHPRSAAWLSSMSASTKRLHPDFGAAPYGIPFVVVEGNAPKVTVDFEYADESDAGPYPFNAQTPIEGGGDRHALMIDRANCRLYELYAADWNGGDPVAGSGAIFGLNSHALRPAGWTSADAAGLPIFPGLVRYDEVLAGEIRHAIRFTAQRTDRSYLWPARHQAGSAANANLPPMGARFRLRADYDISGYSARAQVILVAMKRYGLIMSDNGSDWFFQGTTDSRWTDDIVNGLKSVPGSAFEAVDVSSLMIDANSGQARQPGQTGPVLGIDRAAIDFGTQALNVASAPQAITLRNNGSASLVVGAITVAGAQAADFSVTGNGCTSATLPPNGSCSLSVRFTPKAAGTRQASLAIASNANGAPHAVALSGNGLAPQAGITAPAALDFGKVRYGQTSAVRTISISSSGNAPLQLGTPVVGGKHAANFTIASNGCGASLAPGASCSIGLRFRAGAVGARSATLTLPSNAPGAARVVNLSGQGVLFGP